jgi:DNA-directed RNA polymerase subunit M/transcription elongation factor TFIIS
MADTITITCPECEKTLAAPAAVAGKKVRCKSCGHTFVAQAAAKAGAARPTAPKAAPAKPAAAKPAAAPAKSAAQAPPPPAKPPLADEDEEENSDPYDLRETDLSARCPYCANLMPSEDAIICLECGYNTRTRERHETKKVYHTSGFDWFLWLAPGILCALVVIGLATWDILYWINANEWFGENDPWYLYMWRMFFFKLWSGVLSVYIMYLAGKFAIRRLIFNPRPPEYEKKK